MKAALKATITTAHLSNTEKGKTYLTLKLLLEQEKLAIYEKLKLIKKIK